MCVVIFLNDPRWKKMQRNSKEESEWNRTKNRARTECKQSKNKGLRDFATSAKLALRCETISQLKRSRSGIDVSLWKRPSLAKSFRRSIFSSAKIFEATKPSLAHECHFATQEPSIRSCEVIKHENPWFRNQSSISQGISQLRKRSWHKCATLQHSDTQFAAAKRIAKWLRKWLFAAKLAFFCETQNDP